MQIGEVAERVGLSLRTVRYYEEIGLVAPVGRSPGGFRIYDEDAVERLALVRDLKPLGFSLEEIRAVVEMVTQPDAPHDPQTLADYIDRARSEHRRALRSLGAAERIIDALEATAGRDGGTGRT